MATGRASDIIVIGAGIFGLSCAWACLQRGMRVRVLEQGAVASGASGGFVGALAPHSPEGWSAKKQFQLDALVQAEAFWREVDARSGLSSGYGRTGRLQPLTSAEARGRALRRVGEAEKRWQEIAEWRVEEASGVLGREAAPFGMIRDMLSARIQPRFACLSLASAFRAGGGEIVEGTGVTGIGDGWATDAAGHRHEGTVILAAGYLGFSLLDPWLGDGCGTGVKGQALLVQPDRPFSGPMVQGDGLYIVPHADRTVAVGSTSEDVWDDARSTDARLDALWRQAQGLCPALEGARILNRWAGVRPKARGRDPMVGLVPECAGLFVATGGFKTGFGLAHAVGKAVAALVAGEPSGLPPSFDPARHRLK